MQLELAQALRLMDQLLACEATWHNGHSLAQTVLTCLYLHRPERVQGLPLLAAYIQAVRHAAVTVKALAEAAVVYEEEDFIPFAFNFDLDPAEYDDSCPGASRASLMESTISKIEEERQEYEPEMLEALLCRMRFRKAFQRLLEAYECSESRDPDFDLAAKEVSQARQELSKLAASATEGEGPKARTYMCLNPSDEVGFDASVSRQLLAPAPPRKIALMTAKETLEHYNALLEDLEYVSIVKDLPGLESLMTFMVRLKCEGLESLVSVFGVLNLTLTTVNVQMQLRDRNISVIARSQLFTYLKRTLKGGVACRGQPLKVLILGSLGLRDEVMIAEWVELPGVNAFMDKAEKCVLSLFKVLCANHARQHRRMTGIFDDWEDLLSVGHTADTTPEMEAFMVRPLLNYVYRNESPATAFDCLQCAYSE